MASGIQLDDISIALPNNVTSTLTVHTSHRSSNRHHRHSIRCFKHCTRFVFVFEFPDTCPICSVDLLDSELAVPPFIYKSPLDAEPETLPAILVKPSTAQSFLYDYNNGDFLHCGLLDESGLVHDFDERGLHISDRWRNCVNIPVHSNTGSRSLTDHIADAKRSWNNKHDRYDPRSANCFTFVLFCLKELGYYPGVDEDSFITEVIIPRTTEVARYISLYRQIARNGGSYIKP